MFCTNCGIKIIESAKFCQGCGTAVLVAEDAPAPHHNLTITPEEVLEQSQDVRAIFANEEWAINLLSKRWPKSDRDGFNRKVVGRFRGKVHNPTGGDRHIIFTDQYVGIVNKTSFASNEFGGAIVFEREQIKLVQVGSANYVHHSGTISTSSDWWTVNLINMEDREFQVYLPLGETNYQQQNNIKVYNAKISILSLFWPVSLDGGHIDKSGGFSSTFSVGFWHAIN